MILSPAHITLSSIDPPQLVDVAAKAGFNAVGLRLEPATPEETRFPMRAGTPKMRETKARLADNGLKVLDVEVFGLASDTSFERYRPSLEGAAELGAKELLTTCDIRDEAEAVDRMLEACELAASFDLFVNLEFMPWNTVGNLRQAENICTKADHPNGVVLVDTLHVNRSNVQLTELTAIAPDAMRYIQLCDAPAPPSDFKTMLWQARFERLMPGEGVIPLKSYLDRLPKNLPVSAEVPMSGRLKSIGPLALAIEAARTCRRVLEASGWH